MKPNYQVTIHYGDCSRKVVNYCLPIEVLEKIEREVEYDTFHKRGTNGHKMLMNIERFRINDK